MPHIIERLKQLRMRVPDEGFKVRFKPGEVDMLNAYDYGYNFGCILQDKENPKEEICEDNPGEMSGLRRNF